jgi:hypothetical protein
MVFLQLCLVSFPQYLWIKRGKPVTPGYPAVARKIFNNFIVYGEKDEVGQLNKNCSIDVTCLDKPDDKFFKSGKVSG